MSDLQDYTLPETAPDKPRPKTAAQRAEEIIEDNGLPQAEEAERTILGAILIDNTAFNEAAEHLTVEDFGLLHHQLLFRRMCDLIDAGITVDIVTLGEELMRHREVEKVGGIAWIASLTEGLPRRLSITDWIRLVKEASQLRRIINLASLAVTRAADRSERPLTILESLEGELLEIAQESQQGKLRTIYDSVVEAGGAQPYIQSMTEPSQKPGLPTGYTEFDRMTGGLQKAELTVLAARPSIGKTAFAINIAQNVATGTERVVAVFSLEMSRNALEQRMMAGQARVDVKRATTAGEWLSNTERDKMMQALEDLVEARIFVDDTPILTPTQLRAKCRRLKQREKRLDLVVIDYLQLMSGGGKFGSRQEEVSSISRSLKALAKELDVPVVALAQLNRSNEQRQDKRPALADLRESGQIEQDADVVAFIHRDEYYQPENEDVRGLADVIIAKQRNGPTGIVKLAYIREFTRFENLYRG